MIRAGAEGADDARGAGPFQFFHRVVAVGAGNDLQIGRLHPGGEHDVHVVRVRRQRGGQRSGMLEPRRDQHVVVGRVAVNVQPTAGPRDVFQSICVGIQNDKGLLTGIEVLANRRPHSAHPADHVVILQRLNLPFHTSLLQHAAEFRIDDDAPELEGRIGEYAQTADQIDHNEQHGLRIVCGDILRTDGRERNDGQICGLQPRPVCEQTDANRSKRRQRRQESRDDQKPTHVLCRALRRHAVVASISVPIQRRR